MQAVDHFGFSLLYGRSQRNHLAIHRHRELPSLLVTSDRNVEALVVEHAAQAKLDRRVGQRPPAPEGAFGLSRNSRVESASDKIWNFSM